MCARQLKLNRPLHDAAMSDQTIAPKIAFASNGKTKGKVHRVLGRSRDRCHVACGWRITRSTSLVYCGMATGKMIYGPLCMKCFPRGVTMPAADETDRDAIGGYTDSVDATVDCVA